MRLWEVDQLLLPPEMFHATFVEYLESIMQHGLGGSISRRNYDISRTGAVYLADNPDLAEHYVRESQYNSGDTVILRVDTKQLDPSKFSEDEFAEEDFGQSYVYHGVIPPTAISQYD